MDIPQMKIRTGDSGRGTAGGAPPRTPVGHVSFVDQSESRIGRGSSSSSSITTIEGFQKSQQHLNPLFDLPDDKLEINAKKAGRSGVAAGIVSLDDDHRGKSAASSRPYGPLPLVSTATSADGITKPSLAKRQSTKQLLKPKNALEVEVGPRDTMEKIAIRYRTTPSEICKMNKMASRMIFSGQIIFVPDPDASPVTPSPTKERPFISGNGVQRGKEVADGDDANVPVKIPTLPSLPSFTSVTAITEGVSEAGKDAGAAATSQISSLFSKLNPATHISRSSLRGGGGSGKKEECAGATVEKASQQQAHGGASAAAAEENRHDLDPDQECLERFLKLKAKRITDGRGVVNGTLLVTPNAIMFDPYVMDPLVKEHSADEYGMMAPMECIMSAAMYRDISLMTGGGGGGPANEGGPANPDVKVDSWVISSPPSSLPENDGKENETTTPSKGTLSDGVRKVEQRLSVALGEKFAPPLPPPPSTAAAAAAETTQEKASTAEVNGDGDDDDGISKLSSQQLVKVDEDEKLGRDGDDDVFKASVDTTRQCGPTTPAATRSPTSSPAAAKESSFVATPPTSTMAFSFSATPSSSVAFSPLTSSSPQVFTKPSRQSLVNGGILSSSPSASEKIPSNSVAPNSLAKKQQQPQQSSNKRTHSDDVDGRIHAPVELDDGVADECAKERDNHALAPSLDEFEPISAGSTIWYADLESTVESGGNDDAAVVVVPPKTGTTVAAILKDSSEESTERLFVPIENLLPANSEAKAASSSSLELPLFLCLKVGQPLNKKMPSSGPIASYAKKKKRPEYWFSIPKDRAPRLYAFLLQWTPEVYDEEDDDDRDYRYQRAFVLLGNYEEEKEDDFIRQLSISKDWEIINTDEIERRRSILSMEESIPSPEIFGTSSIFDEALVKKISHCLPPRAVGYPWSLTFSTEENGFSLNSLYRKMSTLPQSPLLLFIKDTNDNVFGAMSSSTFFVSEHFYGNGEMFLFSYLDEELKYYPWSGENNYFIKGNKESLAIGAGEGLFGLWLDEDLYHGRSHPCSTFANDCLSSKEDFVIKTLEIWAFIS